MDGSKQKDIAGETPATASIPWWARAAIYTLAGLLGVSVAYGAALAPDERELDLIKYGELEGQQVQIHEQAEFLRGEIERLQGEINSLGTEWNQIEAEQAQLWTELFL